MPYVPTIAGLELEEFVDDGAGNHVPTNPNAIVIPERFGGPDEATDAALNWALMWVLVATLDAIVDDGVLSSGQINAKLADAKPRLIALRSALKTKLGY